MANPARARSKGEFLIALIGMTGTGKSEFINTVSGYPTMTVGHQLESCTGECGTSESFCIGGHNIRLIDTPGFNDTHLSDTEVLETITAWILANTEDGQRLAGILYFQPINVTRITGIDNQVIEMFESLCGDEFLSNVTLVTTMWGKLSSAAEGDRLEGQLKEKYWKHMIDEGSRCGRYHRDKESGQKLIEELLPALKSNQNAVPRLEKEMLEKGGLANTSAGMALQKRLTNENQMLQRRIRELEKKATEDTPKGRRALEEMVTKQGMLQRNAADEERLKRGTLSRFIRSSAAFFGKEVLRDGARFWSNRDDSMINRCARVWDGRLNGAARVLTGTYKPE